MATNWKNVNNWHWVEKNCLSWAVDYLKEKLVGLEQKSESGIECKVTEVNSVTGDCDLNQRKGKIITIYDLVINLNWEGKSSNGEIWKGKVNIPEFMHDSISNNDITFEISLNDEVCKESLQVKEFIRVNFTKEIINQLKSFEKDLVEYHSKDVYINTNDMNGHPTLDSYKPKPITNKENENKQQDIKQDKQDTITIKFSTKFSATSNDIYNVLTNINMVQAWSRSKAVIENKENGKFVLFDGNIEGEFLKLEQDKLIVQTWRLKSWPKDHYSKVTIDFVNDNTGVTLNIVQNNVPKKEESCTKNNWNNYYWDAIRKTFGY